MTFAWTAAQKVKRLKADLAKFVAQTQELFSAVADVEHRVTTNTMKVPAGLQPSGFDVAITLFIIDLITKMDFSITTRNDS